MADADQLIGPPRPRLKLRWPDRLPAAEWLPFSVLVFIGGAFLLPSGAAYAWPFYLLILPALCLRARQGSVPAPFVSTGSLLALVLLAWSGLTLAWGQDDGHRTGRFAIETVWTLVFAAALLTVLRAPDLRRRIGSVMIWAGAANATLSLVLGQVFPQGTERLHGWGVTSHPILGAIVMTGAYFCALSRGLAERQRRAAHLAAAVMMAGFILMTESRGPMLSAAVGTLFMCLAGPWRLVCAAVLAALCAGWKLLPAALQHHQEHRLVYRGSSHHFEIWDHTLALIGQRPLFGHGLAANLDLPGGITFPHDLYLSVLFYSGSVGFILFAALAASVTLRLWRTRDWRQQDWLWVAAMWIGTLLSGLTDLGQLTKGPGPMWFILWLPICLALTRPLSRPPTRA